MNLILKFTELITQCWAAKPEDRPQSMKMICHELKELVNSHPLKYHQLQSQQDDKAPTTGVSFYYIFIFLKDKLFNLSNRRYYTMYLLILRVQVLYGNPYPVSCVLL